MSDELHPGVQLALERFAMDEFAVAQAIRDGRLASPQRCTNMLLVALRVTGTGLGYRVGLKELVWRDPSFYLNDAFLARCNGLPILVDHPKSMVLTSEEYHDRNVGSVILPYIKGDEVWAIGKIYDEPTAHLIETEQISTSPAVVFVGEDNGEKYRLEAGQHLLVEGKPSLLDHLALCAAGVWDKGGEPSGVANAISNSDQENAPMASEEKREERKDSAAEPATEEERGDAESLTNSKSGEKLDRILAHLDSLHEKHDSLRASHDSMRAAHDALERRIDALENPEEEEQEEEAVKEEGEPTPLAADSRRDENEEGAEEENTEEALRAERGPNGLNRNDKRMARRDAEPAREREEEEREEHADRATRRDVESERERSEAAEEGARRADARADSVDMVALRKQLVALESRIPIELPEEARSKFVSAQVKAEKVAQAFGDSAPRWVSGETLDQYRRRLATAYKRHSKAWKDVDLLPFAGPALDTVETQIYADAWNAAIHPASGVGGLREVRETDRTGRQISKFYGDVGAVWDRFRTPARRATFVATPGRGIN